MATAWVHAFDFLKRERARWSLVLLLLIFGTREVYALGRSLACLETIGGARYSSNSIYEFSDWFSDRYRRGERIYFLNFEVIANLRFLHPGIPFREYLRLESLSYADTPEEGERALAEAFGRIPGGSLLVRHVYGNGLEEKRFDLIEGHARGVRRPLELQREFRDRDGTPVFRVFRVPAPPPPHGSL